ncbi:chlorogenic acid esterase precursor, partial [Colletotrichum incanum]
LDNLSTEARNLPKHSYLKQTDVIKDLSVATTAGIVTGFINDTAPSVRQWLGIPYAEPPIGVRRFSPRKPKNKFRDLTTNSYKPCCIQQLSNASTPCTDVVPEFLINGGQSEDCLYINVYAPLYPVFEKLPVFIYIPGGGFTGGGADSLYKIPDQWIQKTQAHIFVIMNYRQLVIEWTRDNVAAFGGDASKITLWGQSAGAMSVGMYGYAWVEDPIVSALIADSGSASILTIDDHERIAFSKLAGFLGCGNLTTDKKLNCMQHVDARVIQQVLSFRGTGTSFRPVVDGVTAFRNSSERLLEGKFANVERHLDLTTQMACYLANMKTAYDL